MAYHHMELLGNGMYSSSSGTWLAGHVCGECKHALGLHSGDELASVNACECCDFSLKKIKITHPCMQYKKLKKRWQTGSGCEFNNY